MESGDNLEFIFVGPERSKSDQKIINSKMKNMPFPNSINFTGELFGSEKWNVLASFDVFALTSRTEGMPVVVLEAMAFGKPCLVTKGTNMVDFVEQAKGGWGVEPTPEEISAKLKIISALNKEDLREIGRKSRQFFLNNFTWDIVSKNNILKKLKK